MGNISDLFYFNGTLYNVEGKFYSMENDAILSYWMLQTNVDLKRENVTLMICCCKI